MSRAQKYSLVLLRLALGGLFFYAGITKILDPNWSAASYIGAAKTFPELFAYFLKPAVLPIVNLANAWGLALIGISLFLGVLIRWTAPLGMILMALYYLAILDFPYPNAHAYIVDEHVVYFISLAVLAAFDAGKVWGLGNKL